MISLCGGIDMFIDIREDLAGSATSRHRKVTTPKVIKIGISPRMMMMMMMMMRKRERRLIRF
jgi:hypothetical protein